MRQEVQRINNFNKIQVQHQNTEMAKKKKKVFTYLVFNFVKITVVEKYYKILIFKTFFSFFLQQQQNILIVSFKPLIICECSVLFLLTFNKHNFMNNTL